VCVSDVGSLACYLCWVRADDHYQVLECGVGPEPCETRRRGGLGKEDEDLMCHAGMCGVLLLQPNAHPEMQLMGPWGIACIRRISVRLGELKTTGPISVWAAGSTTVVFWVFFFSFSRTVMSYNSEGKFENKVVIEAFQGGSRPWREVIRRPLNLE
jgi:hypothetical protein